MRHRRARRLLGSMGDGLLPAGLEAAVRDHAACCRRCGRTLRELRAAEGLLSRLPASLIPIGAAPQAEARLIALARWARPVPAVSPGLWRLPAFGVLGAVAALALAIWIQPAREAGGSYLASRSPAATAHSMSASFLMPTVEASGLSYSWRL